MAAMQMLPDERKLQPVFDDIAELRYKLADKAINAHLKRSPTSSTAQVARLALLVAQDAPAEEWQKPFNAIRRIPDLSPSNTWRVERALKELGRWDLILQLHQDSATRQPTNEELVARVYLAALGSWNTEILASSARQVFNMTKDIAWARRSAWAEWNAPQPTSQNPFPPPAPAGSLKIAQISLNMARRDLAQTSDFLWLHLQVLLSAGENKQAHELLMAVGHGGGLARDWCRMQGVQEIAKREAALGDTTWVWEQELEHWLDVWTKDSLAQRNYAYYRHSILAAKALAASKPDLVKKLRETLIDLDRSIGQKERAPRLARSELEKELNSGDEVMPIEKWQELVLGYWARWGSKGSAVAELEGIAGKRQQRLLDIMQERRANSHSKEQSYREAVNATLFVLRSHPSSWTPSEDDIKQCWTLYTEGLAYGKNLTDKDVQPADQIGLAAVQLILSGTDDTGAVPRAIACLEWILRNSPACAHAKFLLVRLYRLVGAPDLASARMDGLDPSEIQLDTLLHIWLDGAATDALVEESVNKWAENAARMRSMYKNVELSLPEQIKQALTTEAYSRIHSIRQLLDTQQRSRTRASLLLETCRRTTPSERHAYLAKPAATQAELVDTRNWELMPDIGGHRPAIKDMAHLRLCDDGPEVMRCKVAMETAVAAFCAGQSVEVPEVDTSRLGEVDGIHYCCLRTVLERALGKSETTLDGVYDRLLQLPLDGSRWSALDAVAHVYESLQQIKAISVRIQAGAKRKEKLPILEELATLVAGLEQGSKEMVDKVDAAGAELAQVDWADVDGGMIEDRDFVERIAKPIKDAQKRKITLPFSTA